MMNSFVVLMTGKVNSGRGANMAAEILGDMIKRSQALNRDEKRSLADYLENDLKRQSEESGPPRNGSPLNAAKHLAWLKAHREEYSGKYVALVGDKLVGTGETRRAALEEAKRDGVDDPFIVFVLSENVIADGGL